MFGCVYACVGLCLQGPALCVYNDAVFSPLDWKGIRMLHASVKEQDPLKVGRFGLGFKSVFHLTGQSLKPDFVPLRVLLLLLFLLLLLLFPSFFLSSSAFFCLLEEKKSSFGSYFSTLGWKR